MQNLNAYLELKVMSRNGKKCVKRLKMKANSFTGYFLCQIATNFSNASLTVPAGFKNTDNSAIASSNNGLMNGNTGDTNHGIVIGTDSTPNTIFQNKLGARIEHGSGAGQMTWTLGMSINPATCLSVTGSTVKYKLYRTFTNNSGNSIAVTESGFQVDQNTGKYSLVERTVFAPVTVLNGQTIQATYEMQLTA